MIMVWVGTAGAALGVARAYHARPVWDSNSPGSRQAPEGMEGGAGSGGCSARRTRGAIGIEPGYWLRWKSLGCCGVLGTDSQISAPFLQSRGSHEGTAIGCSIAAARSRRRSDLTGVRTIGRPSCCYVHADESARWPELVVPRQRRSWRESRSANRTSSHRTHVQTEFGLDSSVPGIIVEGSPRRPLFVAHCFAPG